MIYIKPEAGLANRIRAMVSGLAMARQMDKELVIVWGKEIGFNSVFSNIFKEADDFKVVPDSTVFKIIFYTGAKRLVLTLQRLLQRLYEIDLFIADKDIRAFVWDFGGDEINLPLVRKRSRKGIAIKTCHEFYFQHEYLQYFKPVDAIAKRAAELLAHHQNVVGIHIRRTDNEASIHQSPLELFAMNIQKEIAADPSVRFYLATDDKTVYEELDSLFPDRIMFHDKVLDRNSEQGIVDAFVDLITLSRCKKIYGSFYSSFSSVAAAYGNVPLHIIKKSE